MTFDHSKERQHHVVALLASFVLMAGAVSPAAAEPILVHRYDFENNVNDTAGTIDGTLPTNSEQTPEYDGDADDKVVGNYAIYFDGDNDYATIPKTAGTEELLAAGGYSLSFWTKLARNNVQGYFMCDAGNSGNLYLQIYPSGAFNGSIGTIIGPTWDFTNPDDGKAWPVGEWNHHAIVVPEIATGETGTATWYVDGVALDTITLGPFAGLVGDLCLGNRTFDLARDYQGWLDDLQIYQGALSADDVRHLHDNPGATVPEPGSWALLLAVGAGFSLMAYRKKRPSQST